MSDAVSAYDFTTARRGYAPEQVERAVTALVAQRDDAWERLSLLGAEIRELETGLATALQAAEDAPPPDFGLLGERAAGLLAMAEAEAAAVREEAARTAGQLRKLALDDAKRQTDSADSAAKAARSSADEEAEQTLAQARARAAELLEAAERESRETRETAEREAAERRELAEQQRRESEAELAARLRQAVEEAATDNAREQEIEDRIAAVGERRDRESAQHRNAVGARVQELDAEARTRAERLLDRARAEAERIAAGAEREQRAYEERREQVQLHLGHIRQTLATLTGMAATPSVPAPATEPDSETAEIPLPPAQRTGPTGEDHRPA
ncbi:hypothetical protein ACIQGZ_04910 [Streptomyces sp. NPDC092296]|uniref:hypothetical protein n=1 Tax=Streptomyces sp. NPDC092296 TaxID=3366012 RepID=UPI0037FCC713